MQQEKSGNPNLRSLPYGTKSHQDGVGQYGGGQTGQAVAAAAVGRVDLHLVAGPNVADDEGDMA
jgi:hypothetical protein